VDLTLGSFSLAGFIRGVESVPVLISVPLTSFLNDYSLKYGRAGYYICSAAAANLDCDRPTAAGGNVAAAAAVESILIDIIWGV